MPRVGVLGAGIAGLTAAYRLHQEGVPVEVLEAADRPGGVIRSHADDGFLVEAGPNTLRPDALLEDLIHDLDLDGERVWADDRASRRYVVRDGTPTALPTSVGAFLTTDLFSFRAKLRLLAEPFVPRRAHADDESLAAFTRRRLGPEVLDYAVAPFVGGVFAGDPEQLSARHAFGRLVELEEEHGSLFWGALRSDGADDDVPSGLFSFRNGLETLPAALADVLGDRVACDAPVSAVQRSGDEWVVTTGPDDPPRTYDTLICTLPLPDLADVRFEPPIDDALRDVWYPPVHVVALGYERSAVDHPLDGFGMLVPPVESSFDVLGTLFSSTLFPGRAPEGHVLLTTFVGGARAPELAERPPDAVQQVVERDLERLLGVTGPPVFDRHVHWSQAIPQYTCGYGAVTGALVAAEADHPSLAFAGNYRRGVSVGDAAASGAAAAERVGPGS